MSFGEFNRRAIGIQERLKTNEQAQSLVDRAIELRESPGIDKVIISVNDGNVELIASKNPTANELEGSRLVFEASTDLGPVIIDATAVKRVLEDDRKQSDRERNDFTDGVRTLPIVDKDAIPEIVNGVYPTLRNTKNMGRVQAKQIAEGYEQSLYDGNPDNTNRALQSAKKLIGEA